MKEYAEQDVLQLGKRIHNTKRSYLLVNPLQAKHIPVSPTKTYEMSQALGKLLYQTAPEARMVIGFAETATAIAAMAAMSFPEDTVYLHTTREPLGDEPTVNFLEEHSHAVDQQIACLTREKREIGFLESDFLKDAGAFLAGQQIQTKRIIIEDRIAGSSSAAVAFQGRLEGKDDYILDIVFYPDLPGEYIFLLRNVKGNERGNDGQAAQGTDGQNTAQVSQNNNSAQTTQEEAAAVQNNESTPAPQNPYDATNLAIKKIPETLLNYIDNRYEFQYSLYDWLYNHGKKDVESATVTDYSIDGDSRTASIELSLSDGSSISAVYDKTGNSYSFKR